MKQTFLPKVSEAVRVNIRHRQWQHALLAKAETVRENVEDMVAEAQAVSEQRRAGREEA